MPTEPMGQLDLSIVTDLLIRRLEAYRDSSLLWNPNNLAVNPGPTYTISITGSAPETVREEGDCQLSVYLFHVAPNAFARNLRDSNPISSQSKVSGTTFPRFDLNLYYLLTAYSKDSYVQEQQAMSIALRCFEENPILEINVPMGGKSGECKISLTMANESTDVLGRLWQATTVPLRLSTVYQVRVMLFSPEATRTQGMTP